MTTNNELVLAEESKLEFLGGIGYRRIVPDQRPNPHALKNEVLFKYVDSKALRGLDESTVLAICTELVGGCDKEGWLDVLRGETFPTHRGEHRHRRVACGMHTVRHHQLSSNAGVSA